MKETVMLSAFWAFETAPKCLEKGLGRLEIIRWIKIDFSMPIDHKILLNEDGKVSLIGWLFWFYGISTFVGYLTPNPFLCR